MMKIEGNPLRGQHLTWSRSGSNFNSSKFLTQLEGTLKDKERWKKTRDIFYFQLIFSRRTQFTMKTCSLCLRSVRRTPLDLYIRIYGRLQTKSLDTTWTHYLIQSASFIFMTALIRPSWSNSCLETTAKERQQAEEMFWAKNQAMDIRPVQSSA